MWTGLDFAMDAVALSKRMVPEARLAYGDATDLGLVSCA